jgi:phospholipid transport system transporter-binding protein
VAIINLNIQGNLCVVEGELTRNSVPCVSNKQLKNIVSANDMTLDLSKVNKVDTAGLAWLCKLLAEANNCKSNLSFVNMPQQLIKLAALSGVASFLPIK